jgi:hypothetical protein
MSREDQSAWNIFFRSGDVGAFAENRNWFSKSTEAQREAGHTTGAVFDHNLERAGDAIVDGYEGARDVATAGYEGVKDVVTDPIGSAKELFGGLF